MRLSREQLKELRALREHLKVMIAATDKAVTQADRIENTVALWHLSWVDKALLEEDPNHNELVSNIRRIARDAKVLKRMTKNMIKAEGA